MPGSIVTDSAVTFQRNVADCPRWMLDGSPWKNSMRATGLGGAGSTCFTGGGGGGGGGGGFFLQPDAIKSTVQVIRIDLFSLGSSGELPFLDTGSLAQIVHSRRTARAGATAYFAHTGLPFRPSLVSCRTLLPSAHIVNI
jgi:hypothetical protein